jgi:hypothetical protein
VNYKDYFEKNRPKPKFNFGDRVIGTYHKVPFVGSVGNDTVLNEKDGPRVTVHLDLPLKYKGTVHTFVFVKYRDIKLLKEMKDLK